MTTKIRTIIAASAALLIAAPAATAQEVLANTFIPRAHIWNQDVWFPWLEALEEVTEGRVTFDVPAASLAPPPAQFDAAKTGVFDMGYINMVFIENIAPLPQLAVLPFGTYGSRANSRALLDTYDAYFAEADEFRDVQLITFYVGLPAGIINSGAPIASVQDLEGFKAWANPGATATLLDDAGAAVVAAPAVQAYEIISSGTVDGGAGLSLFDFQMFNTFQYAESATMIEGGLTAPLFAIFMNRNKWNEISEQDRQAILDYSRGPAFDLYSAYDRGAALAVEAAEAEGIEVIVASDAFLADLRALGATQDEAWIARADAMGVPGREALDFYRNRAREYFEQEAGAN